MTVPQLRRVVVVLGSVDRQRRGRGIRVGAATLAATAMLAACTSNGDEDRHLDVSGEQVATSTLRGIVDGLCAAERQALEDREAARAAFFGRAHEPLHTLAKAVQPTDRRAAGELLRAKQAVEADLGDPAGRRDLAGDLRRLGETTLQALKILGIKAQPCRS
jgi:hypothetical protein